MNDLVGPALVPRPDIVAAILEDRSKVVLILGGSGAGKTTVLQEAVKAARADRYVSPTHRVMYADPLLPFVLSALGDIVGQIAEEQGALERLGQQLSGAVDRLVESKGRELALAAAREVLGFVRARIGPEAGQALADAVTALREGSAESLGARLGRERPTVAREVIEGFSQEVVALADPRPVLIVLDRCDRLNDDGSRLLADLAEVLPDGAQIWAAVRSDSDPGHLLPGTDASTVLVPPLDELAVGQLLEQRGLPPGEAARVLDTTSGTALDVQAYVGLLEAKVATGVPPDEVVREDTQRRLSSLSEATQRLTERLAVLNDPLPETYLVRLADGEVETFRIALQELAETELVTAHEDHLWIHERRRAQILDSLDPEKRAEAFRDTATVVWEYIQQEGAEPKWLVELAEEVAQAPELVEGNELVRPILDADECQLAVIAGLVELTGGGVEGVEGHSLLSHVRASYSTDGGELLALQSLEAMGAAVIASNDEAAIVVPRLAGLSYAVALGRIGRVFGLVPVPAIASVAFDEVVRSRISPFRDGEYGVGVASLKTLSFLALGRPDDVRNRPTRTERRGARPALITRAGFAGRPICGAFRFDTAEQRDRALDAVTGLDVEFLGDKLVVSLAAPYPMTAVPADRFVNAAMRVTGKNLRPTLHQGEIRERLDQPLSYDELQDFRVRVHQVLRELGGAAMRGAMELDLPLGLHWMVKKGEYFEVEVRGGRSVSIRHDELPEEATMSGPYQPFHLERALQLHADELVVRWTHGFFNENDPRAVSDPVLLEIGRRRAVAASFNRAQRPLTVTLDDSLASVIEDSFRRELADARALAASLPILGRSDWQIPPVARYVLIAREEPSARWSPGARSGLAWGEMPSASGQDECRVLFAEGTQLETPGWGPLAGVGLSDLDQFEAFDKAKMLRGGTALVRSGVARFLSYPEEDLDLEHPST